MCIAKNNLGSLTYIAAVIRVAFNVFTTSKLSLLRVYEKGTNPQTIHAMSYMRRGMYSQTLRAMSMRRAMDAHNIHAMQCSLLFIHITQSGSLTHVHRRRIGGRAGQSADCMGKSLPICNMDPGLARHALPNMVDGSGTYRLPVKDHVRWIHILEFVHGLSCEGDPGPTGHHLARLYGSSGLCR